MAGSKHVLIIEGGPYDRTGVCLYDSKEEAMNDYKAEGGSCAGHPYRVTVAKVIRRKGRLLHGG